MRCRALGVWDENWRVGELAARSRRFNLTFFMLVALLAPGCDDPSVSTSSARVARSASEIRLASESDSATASMPLAPVSEVQAVESAMRVAGGGSDLVQVDRMTLSELRIRDTRFKLNWLNGRTEVFLVKLKVASQSGGFSDSGTSVSTGPLYLYVVVRGDGGKVVAWSNRTE